MQFISLVFLLFATILGIIVGAAVDDNPVTFNCGKDVNPVGFCSQYLLAVDKGRGAYKMVKASQPHPKKEPTGFTCKGKNAESNWCCPDGFTPVEEAVMDRSVVVGCQETPKKPPPKNN
ncbi:hypothetical protein PCANC_05352 [Puccinia coronata f. sp. avenae]|uniref:Hydrophobin n=1 Tax=Puccinia coronata f. sp. avenae TaxID=200324 RepID=A0A2N5VXA8_9BASI|nr:hypothetical protein PCASD_23626 [Puccinia coronata f. sp. avenae]PLW43754.1 hypothetical protein PCASD_09389 [Puccinia coronata f. sp. avenae]PLW54620.1 hypothetical protein PCANC_05352 [Puccinia coronata f. sp. avenae]